MKYENLIDHIGFFDALPSFNQLRQLVRQRAYALWRDDLWVHGSPKSAEDCWIEAERQLFRGMTEGGYVVSLCDRTLEKNQGFYQHWVLQHVSPKGVRDLKKLP
jgi:hypothetical protein